MKRSMLACIVGMLLFGANFCFAAGDLVVNGNLTVAGTVNGSKISSTPAANTVPVSGADGRLAWGFKPAWRGVVCYTNTSQTILNVTETPVAFNNESFDTDNAHDTVAFNSRVTIPPGITKVRISGQVAFTDASATGYRTVHVKMDGSFTVPYAETIMPSSAFVKTVPITPWVYGVIQGHYLELFAYQNSGAAQTLNNGYLSMFVVEFIE